MKLLILIFALSFNGLALACNATILEQDGKYFLAIKKIGDFPSKDEKPDQKLRRGLQEVDIVAKKDKKEKTEASTENAKEESRKSRMKIIYDSSDKAVIERMLKARCP